MSKRRSRVRAAAVVAAVLLGFSTSGRAAVVINSPLFEGQDLGGGTHSLAGLMSGGKTTILFFWAMRCAPCLREMAALEEIYKQRQKDGLEILAVETAGNDPRKIAEILEKLKSVMIDPTYPIIPDPDYSLSRKFSVQVAPRTFLISKFGEIVYSFDGYSNELRDKIDAGVASLLSGGEFSLDAPKPAEPAYVAVPEAAAPEPPATGAPERSGDLSQEEEEEFEKHRYYADFYLHRKDYDQAIASFLKCIKLKPDNIQVRLKIGEAYARKKMYVEAREAWEYIIRISPGNAEADANLRRLLRNEF